MALSKHDSTVVLEVIAAFSIIPMIAIAFFLFQISTSMDENHKMNTQVGAPVTGTAQLDPQILQGIQEGFQQVGQGIGSNNAGLKNLTFFTQKILEKNFTEEEISAFVEEYTAQEEAALEAQKAAFEAEQAKANAPAAE